MTFFELLFGKKDSKEKKKTKAEIEREKQELERKIWEMAEEYEEGE